MVSKEWEAYRAGPVCACAVGRATQPVGGTEHSWAQCSVVLHCGGGGLLPFVGAGLEVELKMVFPGCVGIREDSASLGTKLN